MSVIDDIRGRVSHPPHAGEYSEQLLAYVREYLASGRPLTDLLRLPPVWWIPIAEILQEVGEYAHARLGLTVTLRCAVEGPVHIETGKRYIPPPIRHSSDGAMTRGHGIGRSIHLSEQLVRDEEIDLDPFFAVVALRAHCASCYPEEALSSESLPHEDRLVVAGYRLADGQKSTKKHSRKAA